MSSRFRMITLPSVKPNIVIYENMYICLCLYFGDVVFGHYKKFDSIGQHV